MLQEFLQRLLSGGGAAPVPNRLGAYPSDMMEGPGAAGPAMLAFRNALEGMSAPQGASPSGAPMAGPAPMPAPMPTPAPASAPGGVMGGLGGLIGGLLNPGGAGRNQTIQWLQTQGMDEGTATLMAGNKGALQNYLLDRTKGADPKQALEIAKLQLDIQDRLNPKPEYITGRDGSIFAAGKDGLKQVYGGKPDLPTDVQEYEYAKAQGYAGTFQDFQIEQKRAGASQVNIDQKAEGAFDKKLAENQATMFTDMATEGMNARADAAVLGELEALLGQTGGTLSGISGALARYGIGGDGVSDIQAAQALINKLVPTQRQPGSGTMSDRDVELFTRSLPSLWNTPEGNAKIMRVMQGLAAYKMRQGEIAAAVINGEMSRQDAAKALQTLPNPLAEFKAGGAAPKTAPTQPRSAPAQPGGVMDYRDWLGAE